MIGRNAGTASGTRTDAEAVRMQKIPVKLTEDLREAASRAESLFLIAESSERDEIERDPETFLLKVRFCLKLFDGIVRKATDAEESLRNTAETIPERGSVPSRTSMLASALQAGQIAATAETYRKDLKVIEDAAATFVSATEQSSTADFAISLRKFQEKLRKEAQ